MKGLTARLAISYLLLAVIVLTGAGAFSYRLIAIYLTRADKFLAEAQVEAAINYVMYRAGQNSEETLSTLGEQVQAAYPMVRMEKLRVSPEEIEMLKLVQQKMAAEQIAKLKAAGIPPKPAPPLTGPVRLGKIPGVVFFGTQGEFLGAVQFEPAENSTGPEALLRTLVGSFGLALVAAAVMAYWFSRTLTAPLNRFVQATERLAEGEWDTPLPASGPAEIRALSDALRRMAAHLAAEFRQLRADRANLQQLTAEIAHEIKTPVASLKTYHEQLLDGAQEDPASREEFLRRGARQVDRLQHLAEFLVDMARLRAHVGPTDRQEADLSRVAAQAVEAIRPDALERGLTIVLQEDGGPLPVLGSPQRLEQALDNLLRNALRWSPPGGRITVTAVVEDGQAVLEVADEGPGIPADLLPRLFEPFVKGEGSDGMGLGLAIVSAVAQSYGGQVTAANRPAGGAVFTLAVPLWNQ